MSRIVLIVEGQGDEAAAPNLVSRLLAENHPEAVGAGLFIDPRPVVAGGSMDVPEIHDPEITGSVWWNEKLVIAGRRKGVAGVMALFDGDLKRFNRKSFDATEAERVLQVNVAGRLPVPLAVVVLCQEYESLLIAAAEQLPGYDGTELPPDPEAAPRDAKDWLNDHLQGGSKSQRDQLRLTQAVGDWQPVRALMGCYRRLEAALGRLVHAALPPPEAAS